MAAPPQSQSKQYDTIAAAYSSSNLTDLPGEIITANLLRRGLGDVQDLTILDLACGSGLYSRMVIELGARTVTAVDISSEMLRIGQSIEDSAARDSDTTAAPDGTSADGRTGYRIVYHQADCSQPLDHLGLKPGSFDLVTANWLFNYASNRTELANMWRNVSRYLAPGGRFVGVGELHSLEPALNRSEWAGIRVSVAGETDDATKVHTELLSEPPVAFDSFILKCADWYRDVPLEVGMEDVAFTPPGIEEVPEHCRDVEEWREVLVVPYCLLYTATKT
ncbi:hypothetical protein LTR36_008191 [Oleoguttula mirabilis]|uniref:Methyltransferase type 11 domain-containing protein n=1 Tax=Oleoguttula mirabilis TaxID=1507867 RepID=A0AAV9J8A5_9PEZI|nr:hypothetical protein LTR36_008191 [Oleoguttula mirabilis]